MKQEVTLSTKRRKEIKSNNPVQKKVTKSLTTNEISLTEGNNLDSQCADVVGFDKINNESAM